MKANPTMNDNAIRKQRCKRAMQQEQQRKETEQMERTRAKWEWDRLMGKVFGKGQK